jgi:hypothetical protein
MLPISPGSVPVKPLADLSSIESKSNEQIQT